MAAPALPDCWVARQPHTSITRNHIHAADLLREQADLAMLGYAPTRFDLPINSVVHGPRLGPTIAAVRQAEASTNFRRAINRLTIGLQRMVRSIILANCTVSAWCREEGERLGRQLNPQIEMGKLICALDLLVDHYRSDIERGLASGRILPP